MRALVTGGGGFLGGVIVRMLRERGDSVVSYSRGSYPELARLGAEQRSGDLGDREALARIIVALGRIGQECSGVREIDMNPIKIRPDGSPVAVDALVALQGQR